jgi:two-component system sensor kinase FixL
LSILTITWSMCAAASFMLGLLHLLLWQQDRRAPVYLLSVLMAFSAGACALTELTLMHAASVEVYRRLLQWQNLFVFTLLMAVVWYVKARLPVARGWLAAAIAALWTVSILVNWLSPYSLVFSDITELRQMPTFWGEQFTLAIGPANPWVHVSNLASVLIVAYVIDAAVRTWRSGDPRRALLVGGSVAVFIVLGGIHAPLVDAGIVETPYMVSFAFLAIVLALSYELVSNAVLASRYAREIQANERRWRALLTNVHLAVIGIDPQGRITDANPFLERLTGFSTEELTGKPLRELIVAGDRAELDARLAAAAQSGPRPRSRWDLVCRSGERRALVWSTVRLNDAGGSYAGLLSIGEDITDRLAGERQLERTRHELERLARVNVAGELVATLAHELNQPLAAILSNAQAARRFLTNPRPDYGEVQAILDDIVRDDKRAGDVIHHLRLLLREGASAREHLELGELVQQVLGLISNELDAQGISVKLALASALPPVAAGRVETQQVLLNLLANAIHALAEVPAERREITVRARPQGADAVEISVEDQGPGIAADVLPRLFEPFFTTRSAGLGMGLAICRRIVDAQGGRIWAENTDRGARFCFTLPLAAAAHADDRDERDG